MRVLVTGASGFIGGYLVPALVASDHDVYALVRDARRLVSTRGVAVAECDLSRPLDISALPEVDAIVHLAQANVAFPDHANELYRVNTVSTQELLDYGRCVGVTRFVYASSGAVYGFSDHSFREGDSLVPHNFYAITKINSEQLVEAYSSYFDTSILRFFFPYGSGQHGRLIPGLIDRVHQGRAVVLNGGGRPRINPIYIADVVRVILHVLDIKGHHVLNVAGDEVVDIRELTEVIGSVLNCKPVFESGTSSSLGDLIGDNHRMHELLGLLPLVSLAEGLQHTIQGS